MLSTKTVPLTEKTTSANPGKWLLAAFAAHTAWGMYPVLARYLQVTSHIPTFTLSAVGNSLILIFMLIFVLPKIPRQTFKSKNLWIFGVVVVLRSVTNMLSVRFTLAIYAQLILLLTPFFVTWINYQVYKIQAPRFTGLALGFSILGAVLMAIGELSASGIVVAFTISDWIGIGISFISSFFLALYMISQRRCMQTGSSLQSVLFMQFFSLVAVNICLSLISGENWGQWLALTTKDWVFFFSFVLIALFGANVLQIFALKHLSATVVSSVLAWRLVTATLGGLFILHEQLNSVWQYTGALIILVTITFYLWKQTQPAGVEI